MSEPFTMRFESLSLAVALGYTLLLAALGFIVYGYNVANRWRYRHIPGPPQKWLSGNLTEITELKIHGALPKWEQKYGPIFNFFMGRYPVVVVSDADLIAQVGIKQYTKFQNRPPGMFQPSGRKDETAEFMRSGMLVARGKFWSGMRAACEPLFHSKALAGYAGLMNSSVETLLQRCLAGPAPASTGQSAADSTTRSQAESRPKEQRGGSAQLNGEDAPSAGQAVAAASAPAKLEEPDEPPANGAADDAVEMSKLLAGFTMEVIGTSAFGVNFDSQSNDDSRISREANWIMTPPQSPNAFFRFAVFSLPQLVNIWFYAAMLLGLKSLQRGAAARGYLMGTGQVLLDNLKVKLFGPAAAAKPSSGKATHADPAPGFSLSDPFGARRKNEAILQQAKAEARAEYGTAAVPSSISVLANLLNSTNKETGEQLTDIQIGAQAFTFILAGSETTSVVLSFAIWELAQNPEVEQRLLAEVDAFGWERKVEFQDMAKFPYAEAVINEAMRKWPPVNPLAALQREAKEDTMLGGYHIPRGTRVWMNIMSLHHDPVHYPEPLEFRPERFMEGSEEAAARHPQAYIPFGIGPRKCIGYRFAMEEAILALVRLYQRVTFTLDPAHHPPGAPVELQSGITTTLKGGLWVNVHPRP